MGSEAASAGWLSRSFGRAGCVHFADSERGGVVAELTHRGHRATVALFGAQVLDWTPAGQAPALWLSPLARLDTGKAVRGGIPICWPWFGPSAAAGQPAHGFVRARTWSVTQTAGDDQGVTLTLAAPILPSDPEPWSHAAHLTLTVHLADRLSLALETFNASDCPIIIGEALHTYLAVGDIAETRVTGLEGTPYLDQLTGAIETENAPLRFKAETDRIYRHADGAVTVEDRRNSRILEVEKSGSASTVIWNPWVEKAARLGDMGPDGYRRMLCVETANAGEVAVSLPPGARHMLKTALSVAPMAATV